MELNTIKKSIAAFGLGSLLVFGAVACGEAEDAADDVANATEDAANAAGDAAGEAADAAGEAMDDAAAATEDAANEAGDAMDEAASDAEGAMDDAMTVDPAEASVEDITTALEGAGVADAATVAQTIKDNAPFADVAALQAALPDLDADTIDTIAGVLGVK